MTVHAEVDGRIPCNRKARWTRTTDYPNVRCRRCRRIVSKGIQTDLFKTD